LIPYPRYKPFLSLQCLLAVAAFHSVVPMIYCLWRHNVASVCVAFIVQACFDDGLRSESFYVSLSLNLPWMFFPFMFSGNLVHF
jgi:hypothetical protein